MTEQIPQRPYVMDFAPEKRILRVSFDGSMTDAIMIEAFQRVRQFVRTQGGCCAIADFTEASMANVSGELIRGLAKQPALIPDQYVRVVVGRQDSAYGLARMYQIIGGESRSNLHVVRTLQEAYDLLGVSAAEFSERIEE